MSAKNSSHRNKKPDTASLRPSGFLSKKSGPYTLSSPLVGRAGYKLLDAAAFFRYDFRGKTVLDLGSSTGGFTDVALRLGAKRVFAVEKGTNQLHPRLRLDPRISLFERTDFLNADPATIVGSVSPDVILADISFLPLTAILSALFENHWLRQDQDLLVMFKPQFSVPPHHLIDGVLKNSHFRRDAIRIFEAWLAHHHFRIINKRDNFLAGKNGNLERFYWLRPTL